MENDALTRLTNDLRDANQPPGFAKLPDVPWQEAPPGRTVAEMTAEQQQLVLLAVEGLAAHLRGQHQVARAGSPTYRDLGRMLGILSVTANQLRRWLAAHADGQT